MRTTIVRRTIANLGKIAIVLNKEKGPPESDPSQNGAGVSCAGLHPIQAAAEVGGHKHTTPLATFESKIKRSALSWRKVHCRPVDGGDFVSPPYWHAPLLFPKHPAQAFEFSPPLCPIHVILLGLYLLGTSLLERPILYHNLDVSTIAGSVFGRQAVPGYGPPVCCCSVAFVLVEIIGAKSRFCG